MNNLKEVQRRAKLSKQEQMSLYREDIINNGIPSRVIDTVIALAQSIALDKVIDNLNAKK